MKVTSDGQLCWTCYSKAEGVLGKKSIEAAQQGKALGSSNCLAA